MKSFIKRFMAIFLIAFAFSAVNTSTVSAAEYLIGVRGGYFIWDPWLKDLTSMFEEMETGSGALYGPVASVLLTEDLSFSLSGLFGTQTGEGIAEDIPGGGEYQTLKYSFNTFRMDIDAALSYRVMENFKIFAGYKYWYNKIEYSAMDYRTDAPGAGGAITAVYQEDVDITQPFHGPAAGIGMSMPIGSSGYFFAANLSCLYMWGKMDMDSEPREQYYSGGGWTYDTSDPMEENISMVMYGINV
ncbi:MAG TPA: hypothetical protein PK358_11630 [Spirochaetota bacterium]|nr:hypothetical protein [Spirochaetota bacterium]HPJ35480.1 hypothetical protein [Spirochaetota bacterium]